MSMLEKIVAFCVVFFFIFATRLDIGDGINLAFASLFLVTLAFAIAHRKFALRLTFYKPLLFLALFLSCLAVYHSILALIYGYDFTYFISICASIFVSVVFGWLLSFVLVERGLNISNLIDQLILLCAISVFINSAIIVFEYIFPVFKVFLESLLLNADGANINYAEHSFRFRGLAAAGGAGLSVVNALAILLFIYLSHNAKISSVLALFCSLVIMISNIFTGRTGLIFGIVFIIILVLVQLLKNLRSGSYGIGRAVFLVLFFILFLRSAYNFGLDAEVAAWAFEWVDKIGEGKLDSTSTDELKSMIFFPNDPIHLLFGIGFFEGNGDLYPRTDSGYLKTLLSLGLILGALLYLVIAALFFRLYKVSSTYRWLVVSVLAFMLVVEIKEPFLYQNFASRLILLLSGASLFVLNRRRV